MKKIIILVILLCTIILVGAIRLELKDKNRTNTLLEFNSCRGDVSDLLSWNEESIKRILVTSSDINFTKNISDLNVVSEIIDLLRKRVDPVEDNINFAGTAETDNAPIYKIKLFDKNNEEVDSYIVQLVILKNNDKFFTFRSREDYEKFVDTIG